MEFFPPLVLCATNLLEMAFPSLKLSSSSVVLSAPNNLNAFLISQKWSFQIFWQIAFSCVLMARGVSTCRNRVHAICKKTPYSCEFVIISDYFAEKVIAVFVVKARDANRASSVAWNTQSQVNLSDYKEHSSIKTVYQVGKTLCGLLRRFNSFNTQRMHSRVIIRATF